MNDNANNEEKDKGGRPTLYKEEYCEEIIRLAKTGMNLYLIAEEWEVSKRTLIEWSWQHRKFTRAYARAGSILAGLTVKKVEDNLDNRDFNANGARLLWSQNNLAEQRTLQIANISKGSLNDRGQAILDSVERGEMTSDEFQKSVNALAQLAKIDEVTELRDKVEKLELEISDVNV